jgi:hypothetical protein
VWILYIYKGFHGLGKHNKFVSSEDQVKLTEGSFWQVILSSCLGMALLKISIALNLLRLSPSRWYIWSLWVSIGELSFSGGNAKGHSRLLVFVMFCQLIM